MRLTPIDRARASRPRRRRNYQLEFLENRNLLSVAAVAADVQCAARQVPMTGSGTAVATLGTPSPDEVGNLLVPVTSKGTGHISHLGKVTMTESHTAKILASTHYMTSSVTDGTATFTAANGDKLFVRFSGSGVLIGPQRFFDTFNYTITGGTGRFQDVSGGGTIRAIDGEGTDNQVPFVFALTGTISA